MNSLLAPSEVQRLLSGGMTSPLPPDAVVLGMPHLCMTGLSETWLLKECGHRHWLLLAEAAGLAAPDFRDPAGEPIYAAFLSVSVRAGGNIGTAAVVRSPPDGYTLHMTVLTDAFNATLYDNLNFNFGRDIVPVASLTRTPFVMAVNPSVPAKTISEFIAYAKANPDKINMASPGNGTANHLFGKLFEMMAGVSMVHVPYRGSFLPDLLGGQVQVTFSPIPTSIEYIRTGKLRALAVTSATRQETLPDIPTVAEFIQGYEASGWNGIGAPNNTSAEIIGKLNEGVNAALADAKIKARLADIGAVPIPMTPAEFGKLITEDTEKWTKVIRAANIKVD